MEYVIGADIGSSSVKAAVFSTDGACAGLSRRSYPTMEPKSGYREQTPDLWWEAVAGAIHELMLGMKGKRVAAIGITGHISSMTFVDRSGRPLRPAIGFQDQRAKSEVEEVYSRFGRAELAEWFGIDLPPAATWPLPRLVWFRNNEPRVLDSAHCVLQAKDFINFRLTGEMASDACSSRGMVHAESGHAPAPVFAALGLPLGLLPRIQAPESLLGEVTQDAATQTGLPAGTPVVTGWNDLNAGVLGCGAAHAGGTFNITGTSEHVGSITSHRYCAPELVCAPFLPGTYLLYGATSCGGGSLDWYCHAFAREITACITEATHVPPGSESLLFLPYLEGERSPIWDPCASGAFIGIRRHHTAAHFTRAVLEGVAFSLLQIAELVKLKTGVFPPPVVIGGGGARVSLWNSIKAGVFGVEAVVPETIDVGPLGAAILAAVGVGSHPSLESAAANMARYGQTFASDPNWTATYQSLYGCYCRLYPALRTFYAHLADIDQNTEERHV